MTLSERKCAWCDRPLTGRIDQKTCSDRCRTALKRAESRDETVTTGGASVTSRWSADEPTDELGHWQPAEEEDRWF